MKGDYVICRQVENNGSKRYALPAQYAGREVKAVWLLLNEKHFYDSQGEAIHHVNAFLDDRMHDWEQRGDFLRYYAHSSAKYDVVDVIVYFEAEVWDGEAGARSNS